ncbi:MAG TPA: hypothetical protein VFZ97_06305 [Acidimicrobiales bacterium]
MESTASAEAARQLNARVYVTSRFVALGYDFEIETGDPVLGRYLDSVLSPFARTGRGAHRYAVVRRSDPDEHFALYFEGERQRRSNDGGTVLAYLFWHINSQVISQSNHSLLLHAAGAELGGRAVVLPGPSGAGKSTLVAGLIRAGFRYLTDEAVALDSATGDVVPFPKPLKLDTGSQSLLPELRPELDPKIDRYETNDWIVDVRSIGPDRLAPPAPPAFVVGPAYRRGSETRLIPLRPAETAMLMIQNALNLPTHGRAGLDLVAATARRVPGFRLEVGDLDAACSLITELMIGVSPDLMP